jgi:glycine/D-amino acid oxidase-like deaminating enzyme
MTAAAFARTARRRGVELRLRCTVDALVTRGDRVTGVQISAPNGPSAQLSAGHVLVCANAWTPPLFAPLGVHIPLEAQLHEVVALEAPQPYLPHYPVYKDISSEQMIYARCYGRTQLLASPGTAGPAVSPDTPSSPIALDTAAEIGAAVAEHLPTFAQSAIASSWTGLYDVSPDWNPILGAIDSWRNVSMACGFSGHGFKLSPIIGRLLAQHALGLPTDFSLVPYALERFAVPGMKSLTGRYGQGAVS